MAAKNRRWSPEKKRRMRRQVRKLRLIRNLAEAGKADTEIAKEVKLSVDKVATYRRQAGIKRSVRKHTRESMIEFGRWWYEEFGILSVADWSPTHARAAGQLERVERFYDYGAPFLGSVVREFGSFAEFKRVAGIPPSPRGTPGHGLYKKGR
jgi:hypothetical protein